MVAGCFPKKLDFIRELLCGAVQVTLMAIVGFSCLLCPVALIWDWGLTKYNVIVQRLLPRCVSVEYQIGVTFENLILVFPNFLVFIWQYFNLVLVLFECFVSVFFSSFRQLGYSHISANLDFCHHDKRVWNLIILNYDHAFNIQNKFKSELWTAVVNSYISLSFFLFCG